MESIPQFFVYVLARPNNKPFYVGKGKQKEDGNTSRPADHEREARSGHKCHKCNVIRKIWRQGGEVQRYIVFATDDEAEAYAYEKELIEMYGLGTLANQTEGGRGGMSGVVYSEEQRAGISARAHALAQDPEWRRKVSEGTKAAYAANPGLRERLIGKTRERYTDPAYREKHRATVRRAKQTPAARQRQSIAMLRRFSDPDERRQQGERLQSTRTPEALAKRGASIRQSWQDPEIRRHRIEGQKRAFATDESKERRAAATRRRYESPEERERTRQQNLARYQDPAERQKQSDAGVRRWGYAYTLYSPDGQTHTTNNLETFCKEHGLNASLMRRVVVGRLGHHRKWTGTRKKV